MMRRLLTILLLAVAATAFAGASAIEPLGPGDVAALLKPPARGERIIMLWSLDCVYCEPNMQALAKFQRTHPRQIELVTVATDSIAQRTRIATRLEAAGMQGYPARAYAELSPARINFLIDPNWGGELPRTIVIRAHGSRTAISGELTDKQLAQITP
jgi:ABC-type glycerol-3-phosphate transport system substrate-binding protein